MGNIYKYIYIYNLVLNLNRIRNFKQELRILVKNYFQNNFNQPKQKKNIPTNGIGNVRSEVTQLGTFL
jgi:hypothetical protein